jgi:hypothetical protein
MELEKETFPVTMTLEEFDRTRDTMIRAMEEIHAAGRGPKPSAVRDWFAEQRKALIREQLKAAN